MLIRFLATLILGVPILMSQDANFPADAPQDPEVEFSSAVRDGLPPAEAHAASAFVLSHEEIAIPLLLRQVKAKLEDKDAEEFVTRATGLIAYAASNRAIDAIAELCSIDEQRFGPLVKRLLNHAINREREYEVASFGFEKYPGLREIVGSWVEDSLHFPLSDLAFAKEVLRREKAGHPISEEDALMVKLPAATRNRINLAVERARTEERQRRNEQ